MNCLNLPALDGANPLAYLAALGTLVVLTKSDRSLKLGWHAGVRWTPFLQSDVLLEKERVISLLAEVLRGQEVQDENENKRKSAQEEHDKAKKLLKNEKDKLKELKLHGKDRNQYFEANIKPLEQAEAEARSKWLAALKNAVPSPELAIGQRPDCTIAEFREHASFILNEATLNKREALDMLTAFGAEASAKQNDPILLTRFCFITGSGHQYFLETARQLMMKVSPSKLNEALFEPWDYRDEKFTMRWDPVDDRRYALMDRDPTDPDNKSSTVWMANLLAYRALSLFPCAPYGASFNQACWPSKEQDGAFSWPIWDKPLSVATIRSLLWHPAFGQLDISQYRDELHAMGVSTVFRSHRISVGSSSVNQKINFTPSIPLF